MDDVGYDLLTADDVLEVLTVDGWGDHPARAVALDELPEPVAAVIRATVEVGEQRAADLMAAARDELRRVRDEVRGLLVEVS